MTKFGDNLIYFARALRRAGVPVGPAQVLMSIEAVRQAGFETKQDFFVTLRSCMVTKPEHLDVFEQVFRMFWRDPEFLQHMISTMLPTVRAEAQDKKPQTAEKRAMEAMLDAPPPPEFDAVAEREELLVDAQFSFSANEKLKSMDFEAMGAAEMRQAEQAIARMTLPVKPIKSRRFHRKPNGKKIDFKQTIRSSMRFGGEIGALAKKGPKERWPALVALCDVSGSMSVYSRLFMHFLHSAAWVQGQSWSRVYGFTFGTRLTNITRSLSQPDPDAALKAVGRETKDWEGGTRIGACLEDFNKHWSRRVLGQGAVVLLITDGLERGDTQTLGFEIQRLKRSCRQLIWLNPLLRWDGFEPQAKGIQAILPNVDAFYPCHNLDSLMDLSNVFRHQSGVGEKTRMMAML